MAMTNYEKAVKAVNKAIHSYVLCIRRPYVDVATFRKTNIGTFIEEDVILNDIAKMVDYWSQIESRICKLDPRSCIMKTVTVINLDEYVELLAYIETHVKYKERQIRETSVSYLIPCKKVHFNEVEDVYYYIEVSRDYMRIKRRMFDIYNGNINPSYLKGVIATLSNFC